MDKKEIKKLSKDLKNWSKRLETYKEQLFARHAADPLKSPPVFLLNSTALEMSFKADALLNALKK